MNSESTNMKSLALGGVTETNPITAADIAIFEKALPEAQPRIDRIRGTDLNGVHTPGYRDQDETKLKAIFTENSVAFSVATDIGKKILSKARELKDNYNHPSTGIDSLINQLPSTVNKITVKNLTNSINSLTTE